MAGRVFAIAAIRLEEAKRAAARIGAEFYPPVAPVDREVTVYHAQPHMNRDPLNQFVRPGLLIDIDAAIEAKTAMLAEHRSQKEWLDRSQGMDVYLHVMQGYARELGQLVEGCEFAEGWRRHHPMGFCAPDADPLADCLREYVVEQAQSPPEA